MFVYLFIFLHHCTIRTTKLLDGFARGYLQSDPDFPETV